jgi:hypothetical protein
MPKRIGAAALNNDHRATLINAVDALGVCSDWGFIAELTTHEAV